MAGIPKKGDGRHRTFRLRGKRSYFAVGDVTKAPAWTEMNETLEPGERAARRSQGMAIEDFAAAGRKAPVMSAKSFRLRSQSAGTGR